MEEGPLLHHINGQVRTLYPNTLVLIRPEDQHHFSQKDNITAKFYNLAFDVEQFEQAKELASLCSPSTKDSPLVHQVSLTHELSRLLLRRMKWLCDLTHPFTQEVQFTEGITLLTEILVLFREGGGTHHTVPYWLNKACTEMRSQTNLVQGIPRLVELSGKTQEHLTRSMRKYMGQTPSAYVNAIRLELAAEKLTSTDLPIFDIMLDVGFQNTSYFNKLFKDKYQVSPRQYRNGAMAILGNKE